MGMPFGVSSRYLVIAGNETLLTNMEELLSNAEMYYIDVYKVMELRKNLANFYLMRRNYVSCQKMVDWLLVKRPSFFLPLMSNKDRAIYAMYLTEIGMYESWSKSNEAGAMKYLKEAEEVAQKVSEYPEMKFTLYAQLAQTYVFIGDLENTSKNMEAVESILKQYPDGDFDMGLVWYIKAKLELIRGDYKRALDCILKNIEVEAHLPQDTFTAPTYIMQAEILNYLGKHDEAYKISGRLYKQETEIFKEDHEIHARILVQLSRAELGMGNIKRAVEYVTSAKAIYAKLSPVKDISALTDTKIAAAFVTEGDALASLGKVNEAAEVYATAETIYFNAYRENMKLLDNISYMYYNAAVATHSLKDKFWYNKFSSSLFEKFDREHFRSMALLKAFPE
ncbi:MAG: tetratricopeptide repeat protein [Pseudomonadota bacterium]